MLLKKNDIKKFPILFLRWGITQFIQAKGGFQAPVQCFSLSTVLSLQRIDQLKTNGMQYSWYLYGTKGENPWSSDCETCFMQTPHSKRTFCHVAALWDTQTCVRGKHFIWISGSQVLHGVFIAHITKLWHGKLVSLNFRGCTCPASHAVVWGVS